MTHRFIKLLKMPLEHYEKYDRMLKEEILQIDPSLTIPRELREERARPLVEFIEELKRGEKSG
jgi:hypothetical protein